MFKLIVLVAVVMAVYSLLKGYGRSVQRHHAPRAEGVEDMVRCARCGVHLPKSESILSRGAFFCSDEHRRLHQG